MPPHRKTIRVIYTGNIGIATTRILRGFGYKLLAFDPHPSKAFEELGEYLELDELLERIDIVTCFVIAALKSRKLGALAIDLYEQESALFYQNHSDEVINDDVLFRLMTFPNVIVSGHQGFFTKEVSMEISHITLGNMVAFKDKTVCKNILLGKHTPKK